MNTIRAAYGLLQLLTLVSALPHARRYFLTDRWGGYTKSTPLTDAVQNPALVTVILPLWFASAGCLLVGWMTVAAALVNLVASYYFFVFLRWRSVLRGMGAPGFIAFWLGAAVFAIEAANRYASSLTPLLWWALRIDFAFIMMSAGLYKLLAGYRRGQGMELGMTNPEWGYWPAFWSSWRPDHPLFRALDELAWATEIGAGALMLFDETRLAGAILMAVSFVFIATQIRLGWLCEMVVVCCVLVGAPGSAIAAPVAAAALPASAVSLIAGGIWAYIVLLPIARAGMYYNQLAHRRLPGAAQTLLDGYTNLFGLIIWRVFSADIVNFFVRVSERTAAGDQRLLSDYEGFAGFHRFRQVAECIAVTSVFTTRKYYPSNRELFVERLQRYGRTLPRAAGSTIVFEWVNIAKRADRFAFVPASEFELDPDTATVRERTLGTAIDVAAPAPASPVHEGTRPGSYAPVRH